MFLTIISVFALALSVGALVVAVLTIFGTWKAQADIEALNEKSLQLSQKMRDTAGAVERTTNSKLAAEVDALRGALDVLRASNRREFSAIHGRLGGRPRGTFVEADTGLPLDGDDEINALLALQSAKPAGPGNGSV